MKVRQVWKYHKQKETRVFKLDHALKKNTIIENPEGKFQVILTPPDGSQKLIDYLKEQNKDDFPPTVILTTDRKATSLESLSDNLKKNLGCECEELSLDNLDLKVGEIYTSKLSEAFSSLYEKFKTRQTSILLFDSLTEDEAKEVLAWQKAHILAEDVDEKSNPKLEFFYKQTHDIVPATSFAYMASEFLSKNFEDYK